MSSSTSVQGEIMDLDLNQEPDSPPGLITEISPWLNELETAHERIEDRLRQLEAIVSRIRERAATVTTTTTTATPSPAPALIPPRDSTAGVIHERSRERLVENDKTYLIAKALNMERTTSVPGGYFDCNICLEKAEDPILTCCGHLFCWGCFYQLPFIYLNIKECPVCDGEVTDTEVIPIYGNGDDDNDGSSKAKREECGIRLPPRPNAKRVESIRQKIITRGNPFIPGPETLEHIRRTIDSIGGLQALAEGHEFGLTNIVTNNRVVQNQHNRLRLLSSFPGLVVDSSEMPPPTSDDAVVAAAFDVDSFVDTTTPSLRTNRRRSSRIAEISPSPSPAVRASIRRNQSGSAAGSSSSPRDFAVAGFGFGSREVATSDSSSSRRRTEDVNNGPRTRSRRRLG
ncbi:uncharacterized protein LOC103866792 [Brassica rapa]|uniref:E3 ubiquitin-protein ligase RMA n=1 Tax=Brassica campestris TaxID=3711 RepID=M4CKU3_BRACM|nr:uncharacterized protein LOC103866792 [Brassica rapa]XP_009143021.1 uncharacterized protein LOC103866792 [Brassica rapa]